ncbi:hypothetical protein A3C18_00220 [Candidatus Kaiserbacteria bacterium RIFCSPHIGHO2_02_FULL_54_11b]|uniref:Haloacid dehalogenase n=2 Tax=Candidatus Kaiseribacteriota TaxID=1752734 RepID=A0A1F6CMI6_9BACT|nr:MAG: hypothetical protein A2704_05310 [Candidatus Kaiserbacteria bacterium RIFCSPHIGHO2_01_FULL_54_36b]OGG64999.1 MAG: hypothetical protein A3C18_00220 [Candidatus Kaiserbacteria bacterium RIFCSPHIGHO2_02_FULL_54_11b]
MNKAFIFDMDGVLIDSEPVWEKYEREYLPQFFGKEVAEKMGNLVGLGVNDLMDRALALGAVFDRKEYLEKADKIAKLVYAQSAITVGVEHLADQLTETGFKLGLVSQSPHNWIDQVVPRLPFNKRLNVIVSLHDHPELKRKPEPDGFIEALRLLNTKPEHSIILEDSNLGIQAAKAAHIYTIGFRGNLVKGYEQTGADAYADTMDEVIRLIEARSEELR